MDRIFKKLKQTSHLLDWHPSKSARLPTSTTNTHGQDVESTAAPCGESTRTHVSLQQPDSTRNRTTPAASDSNHDDSSDADKQPDDHRPAKEKQKRKKKQKKKKKQKPNSSASCPKPNCFTAKTRSRLETLAQIGEDWLYLALLGIIMAFLSFFMDSIISMFINTRLWLSREAKDYNLFIQYIAWCLTPILLVAFSTGFVHLCSPTAIGSGIPEMKTILRGVVLNEYLTFRTLVAKIVGLTFTLGSGLPLGKEGPSVHMASIVATLLSKLVASFRGIYENESRTSEMLSAACAVGVAATFYAPIGGVLFSIEVTTVYFAVRNYWRGFFAACCGATIWRLLGFWIKNDESISALFKTNFSTDYPFDPIELLVFAFIGASSGLAGAAYIKFHREIVQFFRRQKRLSDFLLQNRFVYPTLVTLIITSSSFPPFLGQYTAATLTTHTTIEHLFSNRTWSRGNQDLISKHILDHWTTPTTSFHLHLLLYIVFLFWTSALASTIPTPSGIFIPVLKMGAAYGRLIGELMASAYPNGIKYGGYSHPAFIVPGSYAVVGAASFSGAVTHTISTSVILFEMTGQIVHIIPVISGVLIANAVCQSLQPSIYDSIIEIKKLPYLPPIASSNSVAHRILVRDFMNTNIPFVWKEKCSYADLKSLLSSHTKIISFPLVESAHSMKLLGSVARPDLLRLLYVHLGRERRLQEVYRRNSDTLAPAIRMLNGAAAAAAAGQLSFERDQMKIVEEPGDCDVATVPPPPPLQLADSPPPLTPLQPVASKLHLLRHRQPDKHDEDTSRLIMKDASTSTTANRSKNYGATTRSIPSVSETIELRRNLAGPRDLLSECQHQPDSESDDDDKYHRSVAKSINHYNRGSSMDDEQIGESINEIETQLAATQEARLQAAEIIFVVAKPQLKTQPAAGLNSSCSGPVVGSSLEVVGVIERPSVSPAVDTPTQRADSSARPVTPPRVVSDSGQAQSAYRLSAATGRRRRSYHHVASSPSLSLRPPKSILKPSSSLTSQSLLTKRNLSAHNFAHLAPAASSVRAPLTLTANKLSGLELSIDKMTRAAADCDQTSPSAALSLNKSTNETAGVGQPNPQLPATRRRKVRLPRLRVVDMTPEEQEQWEQEQLNDYIDINRCQVDEAPFQLVEQTSLYRVHTLFSMLGLDHAYVTSFGRLVGIVALKDIRYALEKMLQEK